MVDCIECKNLMDCQSRGKVTGRLTSCPDFQQKPMTNADRIRAMTDEELAKAIGEHSIETPCDIICGGKCRAFATLEKTSDKVCEDIILNWLQQPCGGADHA